MILLTMGFSQYPWDEWGDYRILMILPQDKNTGNETEITLDWSASYFYRVILNNDTELAFKGGVIGEELRLFLIQDTNGNRIVTWPASCKFPGGMTPVLTTTANAVDIFTFVYDGIYYYCIGYTADVK